MSPNPAALPQIPIAAASSPAVASIPLVAEPPQPASTLVSSPHPINAAAPSIAGSSPQLATHAVLAPRASVTALPPLALPQFVVPTAQPPAAVAALKPAAAAPQSGAAASKPTAAAPKPAPAAPKPAAPAAPTTIVPTVLADPPLPGPEPSGVFTPDPQHNQHMIINSTIIIINLPATMLTKVSLCPPALNPQLHA